MRTTNARYGRPKGTGIDDSRQLASMAALLVANPKLKPTTAIRSLGIHDPSVVRRLRDKFHMDQGRLLADARRGARAPLSAPTGRYIKRSETNAAPPPIPATNTPSPTESNVVATPLSAEQPPLLATWFALGLWTVCTTLEQQAVLTEHWLRQPPLVAAARGQLAVGAFVVAVCSPRKPLKPRLH
jgi:hypothetical protein